MKNSKINSSKMKTRCQINSLIVCRRQDCTRCVLHSGNEKEEKETKSDDDSSIPIPTIHPYMVR